MDTFLPCFYAFLACFFFSFIFEVKKPAVLFLASAIGAAGWAAFLLMAPIGSEVARYVRGYLASHNLLNCQSSGGSFDFYVSDQVDGFIKTAEFFLGETLSQQVSQVDIDRI